MYIGIIGAMAEEVAGLIPKLEEHSETTIAGLAFHQGKLNGQPVIVVRCGVGKVNAAVCTQLLIDHFQVTAVINTGVAGGVDPNVKIGDVIIAEDAVHHDFDVTVFGYKPGTVPGFDQTCFLADQELKSKAVAAAHKVVGPNRTHLGTIASGDQFISSSERKHFLFETFQALCAEMEGAAIAHTAYLNQIPYIIIRAISDQADAAAPADFETFLDQIIPDLNSIVSEIAAGYSDCSKR
ncbi:MAG: 5'-methylthioadenosine/adenosylhomocysteine nucleosidase [Candidatus Wallacebacter cryptica]|nr:5'-methylthioadenosine/adenosylhomocysteine nucleosidase [Bacillota bacterium]